MLDGEFPARLLLALKALSISRGRLAVELAVDKSVISRWLSGHQAPTGENLANLTALVAGRRPGFTLLDWEADIEALSAKLGVATEPTAPWGQLGQWLPEPVLQEAHTLTGLRGDAYEGFWRTTRPAIGQPGQFVHDPLMIRKAPNGFLTCRSGVEDMRFQGWAFLTQTQLFAVLADARTGIFLFCIFNAVMRHRAEVLDGLTLTIQRVGGGSPVAGACLLERVGFLTGDEAADDATFEASVREDPLAPDGSIPPEIVERLLPDVGPSALVAGGMAMLAMPFATSLSRGPRT
ncbi:hypothetical protein [Phenylobacterium sp.]|uniref:hypothetical protein n=1 Tax=Phenylobacterium sp. TaxID=1871053 RepID=UPI0025EAF832|nr:hypothetical protein [Phenylobacterium sp.]